MKILAVCPMPRLKHHALYFPTAMETIFRQNYDGQIDFHLSSGDATAGERFDRVTMKYERARWIMLEQGYDAMWCVEYDMLIPPNALTKLTQVEADIAYGLYCWRWEPYHWSAYTEVGPIKGTSISENPEAARDAWGKTIEVAGVGQGCTLIRRHVLEKLSFKRLGTACCDWYLAREASEAGFVQKCDTSVQCGHTGLTPRPFTVWPTIETEGLYTLEVHP
jgi:hypothetical protein